MRAFHLNELVRLHRKKKLYNLIICLFNILYFFRLSGIFNHHYIRYHLFKIFFKSLILHANLSFRLRRHRSLALRLQEFSAIKRNPFHIPHVAGLCAFFQESDNGRTVYDRGSLRCIARPDILAFCTEIPQLAL